MMNCRLTSEGNIRIENATNADIKFRHFSGEKDPRDRYSVQGVRYFNIALPEDFADELNVQGWRVKFGKEKEDGTRYSPMIKVSVNFDSLRPPVITRWTSKGKVEITKDIAKDIDTDEIESAAFIITPYIGQNSPDGKKTPYLKNMRYKIEEDPFAGLYENEDPYEGDLDWLNGQD